VDHHQYHGITRRRFSGALSLVRRGAAAASRHVACCIDRIIVRHDATFCRAAQKTLRTPAAACAIHFLKDGSGSHPVCQRYARFRMLQRVFFLAASDVARSFFMPFAVRASLPRTYLWNSTPWDITAAPRALAASRFSANGRYRRILRAP